jgi:hypothetical protein
MSIQSTTETHKPVLNVDNGPDWIIVTCSCMEWSTGPFFSIADAKSEGFKDHKSHLRYINS